MLPLNVYLIGKDKKIPAISYDMLLSEIDL